MRSGGRPIWTTTSATENVSGARWKPPKASNAATTRREFSGVGSTHAPMSPVYRGAPCAASA